MIPDIRHCRVVQLCASDHGVLVRSDGREIAQCRILADDFPDYQRMLSRLPAIATRVTIAKDLFQRALEEYPGDRMILESTSAGISMGNFADGWDPVKLLAAVTGPDLAIRFAVSALFPAIATAIGLEVMLDFHGPGHRVMVRSADRGDLTALVMPIIDSVYEF